LIDDGGKAATVAAKKYPQHAHLFRAVEQTTRGITEITTLEATGGKLGFPVVDVARAALKKHESTKIGAQIAGEIEKLLGGVGLDEIRGRAVTVMGYGMIGVGTAAALAERGAKVTVWDVDPAKRAEAAARFDVPATREEALRGKSLVVGATGHRSITRADVALLGHECVLASASSRDVEIDLSINRDKDVETVPLLAAGRGDKRFITRVWRFPEKDVVVLRNGFPLNFRGDYETGTNEDIQQTRALMLLAAAQAIGGANANANAKKPKANDTSLVPLALDVQRAFAARAGIQQP
jgi:S-adenosylhomocysteine hydrolase